MTVRPRPLALAVALLVALFVGVWSGGSAVQAQDQAIKAQVATTVAATSVETTVAGDPADVGTSADEGTSGEGTTDTVEQVTQSEGSQSSLLTESRKLVATIAGLVLCALALTVLTVRYWQVTSPKRLAALDSGPHSGTEDAIAIAVESAATESASADTDVSDAEPGAAGAGVSDTAAGDADTAAGATDSASAVETVSIPSTLENPVVVLGDEPSGSDTGYEPMGTGEHDRVVVKSTIVRPGARSRAAALKSVKDT